MIRGDCLFLSYYTYYVSVDADTFPSHGRGIVSQAKSLSGAFAKSFLCSKVGRKTVGFQLFTCAGIRTENGTQIAAVGNAVQHHMVCAGFQLAIVLFKHQRSKIKMVYNENVLTTFVRTGLQSIKYSLKK